MAELLAEHFAECESNEVEWKGELAYATYELPAGCDSFTVRFETAVASPVQGLRLKSRGALLTVADQTFDDVVLWRDSAPESVKVTVGDWQPGGSIRVWNVWRGGREVVQAWLGNAGMRVDRRAEEFVLRCSSGGGAGDFQDLVVAIAVATRSD